MCRVIADGRAIGVRHGIETTRMPWVASPEALYCQPTAPEQAEPVDGFRSIVGTGRMETACGTEERAHGPLVYSDQERGNVAHCWFTFFHSATRLACRSAGAASLAWLRAL